MPEFTKKIISDYVVVDLETTGLSPDTEKITEIAAVKVINNEITDTFSTLVDPRKHISYAITAITGIDDSMVRGAPYIEDVMPDFLEFTEGLPLLGHNIIHFDLRFLCAVHSMEPFCVDTLDIANHMHIGSSGTSLTALCEAFGITNDNAHRALSDCLANHKVYQKMKEHFYKYGAYFTMALSCGRKEYQENIGKYCSLGTKLTVSKDKKGSLLLYADGFPVGTVSGGKQEEYEENASVVSDIKVSKLVKNRSDKYLLTAEVTLTDKNT